MDATHTLKTHRLPSWVTGRIRWVVLGVALLVLAGVAVALVEAGVGRDAMTTVPGSAGDEAALLPGQGAGADGSAARTATDDRAVTGGAGATEAIAPPEPATPPAGVPVGEPKVIKHADLVVEVGEGSLTQAFDRVAAVARGQGGFVVSTSTSSFERGRGRSELTLRVPAQNFDAARAALAEVGTVTSQQVSGEDVSAQLVDLEARLRALRAEEDALNTLLGRAASVGEVLQVRQQVSATRMEIEQLAAQQASLEDSATFSTLRVALSEPGAAGSPFEPEPVGGLARSFDRAVAGAVAVAGGMVVVLGYAAPFLVLGLVVWAALRLVRSRRRPAPAG
jgi:hypothetical protein